MVPKKKIRKTLIQKYHSFSPINNQKLKVSRISGATEATIVQVKHVYFLTFCSINFKETCVICLGITRPTVRILPITKRIYCCLHWHFQQGMASWKNCGNSIRRLHNYSCFSAPGEKGFKTGYSCTTKEKKSITFCMILKIVKSLRATSKGNRLYKISAEEYESIDRLYYISTENTEWMLSMPEERLYF